MTKLRDRGVPLDAAEKTSAKGTKAASGRPRGKTGPREETWRKKIATAVSRYEALGNGSATFQAQARQHVDELRDYRDILDRLITRFGA